MAVRENRSLNKPIAMDDMLWELIQMCWRVDPTLRPTASDIVEHLKSQLEAGKQGSSCVPEWNDEVAPCATIRVPSPMSTIAPHQESYETITGKQAIPPPFNGTIQALFLKTMNRRNYIQILRPIHCLLLEGRQNSLWLCLKMRTTKRN